MLQFHDGNRPMCQNLPHPVGRPVPKFSERHLVRAEAGVRHVLHPD